MWRVFVLASLLGLLALGAVAYADCTTCLTSVFLQRPGSGTSVTLTFTARADGGTAIPAEAAAVVMQVDGQRTKCQTITLLKTAELEGVAVYSGTFSAYGTYSHSGRVELGGQIYDFTVPLDGTAGKIAVATDQTPLARNRGSVFQVTAAPATPLPTPPAASAAVQLPKIEPAFVIGAAVILVTIVGAYVDRRRALARSLAA